jgi:tRNA-binding protein
MAINVFSLKQGSNRCLAICLSNDIIDKVVDKGDYVVLRDLNSNIIGVNILNYDEKTPLGYLLYDSVIDSLVKSILSNEDYLEVSKSKGIQYQVAKILEHELVKGTHLNKCIITTDNANRIDIICGAPNVSKDSLVVFCNPGTFLKDGNFITSGKIREFTSNGMLCSKKELGLGLESSGIYILENSKYQVGDIFKECYNN